MNHTHSTSVSDILDLGTILGVWAHPDDEAWSSSGIMAQAVRNGQRVVLVTATKGDAGETADEARWPKSRLGEIHEQELADSLAIIGVTEHTFLDYKDGTLLEADEIAAVERIGSFIHEVMPDTILTFGPDGITGHDDHRTICRWTCLAAQAVGFEGRLLRAVECTEVYERVGEARQSMYNVYFNIDTPPTVDQAEVDFCITLPDNLLAIKIEALRAHTCQTAQMFADPAGYKDLVHAAQMECFMDMDYVSVLRGWAKDQSSADITNKQAA